jgi:hypothetical protein
MAYPHQAKTNKDTQLIILGGDNIVVRAGTAITVYGEDGAFGTVSIKKNGEDKFGVMLKADYDPT